MITDFMKHDHHEGDSQLAGVEDAVAVGDFSAARAAQEHMAAVIERHLKAEEELLFPAMEEQMGPAFGPTSTMRHEHGQMRLLLESLAEALDADDADSWFAQADALRILMQQHNLKEESVLYPMAERMLGSREERVLAGLREQLAGSSKAEA